ncbi:hypothetical protein IWX64_002691 [Arthrobacter sp. CAN_A212]|uniref:hypothetical protein n=1 Tax=Arthrobacter sp. CAN_A212 TaxID=2787719 RepID=UPI0018CBE68C
MQKPIAHAAATISTGAFAAARGYYGMPIEHELRIKRGTLALESIHGINTPSEADDNNGN